MFGGKSVWSQGHTENVSFDCLQPANLHDPNCAFNQKSNNAFCTVRQENAFPRKRGEPSNSSSRKINLVGDGCRHKKQTLSAHFAYSNKVKMSGC